MVDSPIAVQVPSMIPNLPRSLTARMDLVEHLFIFESIHGCPETIIFVGEELTPAQRAVGTVHEAILHRPSYT